MHPSSFNSSVSVSLARPFSIRAVYGFPPSHPLDSFPAPFAHQEPSRPLPKPPDPSDTPDLLDHYLQQLLMSPSLLHMWPSFQFYSLCSQSVITWLFGTCYPSTCSHFTFLDSHFQNRVLVAIWPSNTGRFWTFHLSSHTNFVVPTPTSWDFFVSSLWSFFSYSLVELVQRMQFDCVAGFGLAMKAVKDFCFVVLLVVYIKLY